MLHVLDVSDLLTFWIQAWCRSKASRCLKTFWQWSHFTLIFGFSVESVFFLGSFAFFVTFRSVCFVTWWICRVLSFASLILQMLHSWGLLWSWLFVMWLFRELSVPYLAPHMSHLKHFSSKWKVPMWLFKPSFRWKLKSQTEHLKGRTFSWTLLTWPRKWILRLNLFWQIWQANFLTSAWTPSTCCFR